MTTDYDPKMGPPPRPKVPSAEHTPYTPLGTNRPLTSNQCNHSANYVRDGQIACALCDLAAAQRLLRDCESLLTMQDRSKAWLTERDALLSKLRRAAVETSGATFVSDGSYPKRPLGSSHLAGCWKLQSPSGQGVCNCGAENATETSGQPLQRGDPCPTCKSGLSESQGYIRCNNCGWSGGPIQYTQGG